MSGLFSPEGGFSVRILDLSGASGEEPVEMIRGFQTLEHANAFARRYVRDSLERCRAPGMNADAVLAAWLAFGEDAEIEEGGDGAWSSATERAAFAATPCRDREERNWRILDPRADQDDEDEDDDDGDEQA
ncbi:MAG TPA: hypothetical protein VGM87_10035 [Roseomonas sp.]|jgi:hypothetical protein